MNDKTVLEQLDWALSIADKSNKIDRHKIVGRVVCENIDAIRAALSESDTSCSEDRKDAERYRWIRDAARNQWDGETAIDVIEAGGRQMDAAIDAARTPPIQKKED